MVSIQDDKLLNRETAMLPTIVDIQGGEFAQQAAVAESHRRRGLDILMARPVETML